MAHVVEPATALPFQRRAALPNSTQTEHTLLGVGVRQITFLRFNTYAVGLYLSEQDVKRIRAAPSWRSHFCVEGKVPQLSSTLLEDLLENCAEITVQLCRSVLRVADTCHALLT